MAHSPSQRWEDGRLVERAIAGTVGDGEGEDSPAVTGRPNDVAGPNSTFADRAAARPDEKAVEPVAAENKSVKAARRRKK